MSSGTSRRLVQELPRAFPDQGSARPFHAEYNDRTAGIGPSQALGEEGAMSFWVSAYCHRDIRSFTAKDLLLGITDRLATLAEQFPGDRPEEESPEAIQAVLRRLEIAPGEEEGFPHHALCYLP